MRDLGASVNERVERGRDCSLSEEKEVRDVAHVLGAALNDGIDLRISQFKSVGKSASEQIAKCTDLEFVSKSLDVLDQARVLSHGEQQKGSASAGIEQVDTLTDAEISSLLLMATTIAACQKKETWFHSQ